MAALLQIQFSIFTYYFLDGDSWLVASIYLRPICIYSFISNA